MAPALVAVGTYALLLAWNEYHYAFLLLSTPQSMTVAVALAQFLNSDESSPWNYMMAATNHLRAAADHPVLRLPALHGGGPDHGWREG